MTEMLWLWPESQNELHVWLKRHWSVVHPLVSDVPTGPTGPDEGESDAGSVPES